MRVGYKPFALGPLLLAKFIREPNDPPAGRPAVGGYRSAWHSKKIKFEKTRRRKMLAVRQHHPDVAHIRGMHEL